MWSTPVVVTAPAEEPILLNQAKEFLRLDIDEDGFDGELGLHIAGARARIEAITNTRMIRQTLELQADSFADLERLPVGPATSIEGISYLDADGQVQALDLETVELSGSGLEVGIQLVSGSWPSLRAGRSDAHGRVKVRVVVGYGDDGSAMPQSLRIGMLLQIRALFDGGEIDLDPWIVNDRIWL